MSTFPRSHTVGFLPSRKKNQVTMVELLAKDFEKAATIALKCSSITPAVFVSFFGASPVVVASAWRRMKRKLLLSDDQRPRHLLWALAFLKQYTPENVLSKQFNTSVRTWRDNVWKMIDCLSRIGNVSTSWLVGSFRCRRLVFSWCYYSFLCYRCYYSHLF